MSVGQQDRWLALLEEIRAIAQTGLGYARHPYDRERYERLMAIAAREYSAVTGIDADELSARFRAELGYATPKVGVAAAVFDERERILLIRRADDGRWCLPGGWVEVNESPEASAAREVLEETGYEVRVGVIIRVGSRQPSARRSAHSSVHLLYAADRVGGCARLSHESLEVGFHDIDSVTDWHMDHHSEAIAARDWLQARAAGAAGARSDEEQA